MVRTINNAHFNPTTKLWRKIILASDECESLPSRGDIRAITVFGRRYTTAIGPINWEKKQIRISISKRILEQIFSDNPGIERRIDALGSHDSLPIGQMRIEFLD